MNKAPEDLRAPPSYQTYASDVLASQHYRMMSFAERGLWDTLYRECWLNGRVPSDHFQLSLLLNKPLEEVSKALTSRVLKDFEDNGGFLVCPELERQKRLLMQRRDQMSKGGRKGGQQTQRLAKKAKAGTQGPLEASLKPLSRDELSGNEMSLEELPSRGELSSGNQEWLDDYDRAEKASAGTLIARHS